MKTTNNTVLIMGGSAGIGFEIAKQLHAGGNEIIITGRNKQRLQTAISSLPGATSIVSDIASEKDTEALVERIKEEFPQLNIVINNAAAANIYPLTEEHADSFQIISNEIHTNYLSIIRLNSKLLPFLQQQPEAAIVNVSSVVAYVPGSLATYSASKAALHSYTQSLRYELLQKYPHIKVFELFPPLVNTEFSAPIGGANGISPTVVAEEFVNGLASDTYEIRVGFTEQLYKLFLSNPEAAFAAMHPATLKEEYAQ